MCCTGARSIDSLVAKARRSKAGVILMGYEGLRRHSDTLLPLDWGYVILDEGHRIRNPDAEITLLCKQVRPSILHNCPLPCKKESAPCLV